MKIEILFLWVRFKYGRGCINEIGGIGREFYFGLFKRKFKSVEY